MVSFFRNLRAEERRDTLVAFALLGALVASHSVLEAARDALFLVGLPASRLPVVYLAIGVASLVVSELQSYFVDTTSRRKTLQLWSAGAGVITLGFWVTLPVMGDFGLYALYVWSGVVTTLILVHFWTLLSGTFSVTEAKRAYGVIGLGSVSGGIAGSAAASLLVSWLGPRHLVAVAGLGWLLAAAGPRFLRDTGPAGAKNASKREGLRESIELVAGQPFVVRLVAAVLLSSATVTFADYVFKSSAAAHFAPEELGAFFANTYLALNVVSFGVQLVLVGPMIARLGVLGAFALLPMMLFGSAVGVLLSGGWLAALLLKGGDGALRHTTHRTSLELLFVPLPERMRDRAKTISDVIGQRGGQALASVAILILAAVEGPLWIVAAAVVVLSLLWLASVLDIRRHYVDLFRRQLSASQVAHLDQFPDLDMGSLESLIAALDSDNDKEVIAALDILELERKAHLIPSLIVYHPSVDVCRHALSLFVRNGRSNATHAIDRILDHPSPTVRGAAIVARSILSPNRALLLERRQSESSEEVRAMIAVGLAVVGGEGVEAGVNQVVEEGSPASRIALAEAIMSSQMEALFDVLQRLAHDEDNDVRCAAARAIGAVNAPELLAFLVPMLRNEGTRKAAARALVRAGDQGFTVLDDALDSNALPLSARWRIPQLMVDCAPGHAGRALLERLAEEGNGLARYGIILALETRARRFPDLPLDRELISSAIENTLRRCYGFFDTRARVREGAEVEPERRTPGHELLEQLLTDKLGNATDRLLRLLALQYPFEDFRTIRAGLSSEDRKLRATGVELLESILRPSLRDAVLALVDDRSDQARATAGRRYFTPRTSDYDALLNDLLESSSAAIRATAVFHVGELGLRDLDEPVRALQGQDDLSLDVGLALERMADVR
ncbi:MAG: HEAT repeat domain-containing protein [Myxococcota bacterium]